MKKLLLAIPCYNEEENIKYIHEALINEVCMKNNDLDCELLFINDGSKDNTVEEIKKLIKSDHQVSFISLSRNFGKEIAMVSAFDYFEHDALVVIDADLQHPPELINDMLKLWKIGYEDVYAKRNKRHGESWLKVKTSRWFYKILERMSKTPIIPDAGDFRLLDKKVVIALRQLRESERYTKGLYNFIGFKKIGIDFDANPRLHGKTKWNYTALIKLAIEGITSYTTTPLRISTFFGFFVSLSAFLYMIYVFFKTLIFGADTSGFPSLMIMLLFLGGCILISNGILGEYLARIFVEVKNRPLYFIEESNLKEGERND